MLDVIWWGDDMWRYGGALDDVLVISGEDVRVQELNIEAGWNWDNQVVALDLFVDILNFGGWPGQDLVVSAILQDPEGAVVHTADSRLVEQIDALDVRRNQQIHLCCELITPSLWSPENGALYRLLLTLETRSGHIYDAVSTEFGIRKPTAHAYEILNVHQKIWIEAVEGNPGTYQITNQFDYLSLAAFEPKWELFEDGVSVGHGVLAPLPIESHQTGQLHIPKVTRSHNRKKERVLKLSFHARQSSSWASQGQCVAQAQFNLATDWTDFINWEACQVLCA